MAKKVSNKGNSKVAGPVGQNSGAPDSVAETAGVKIAPHMIVPMDLIEPPNWNPNAEKPEVFNELVDNIKRNGFADPIQVVVAENGYRVVQGEHRWKAAKILGMTEIPVMVVDWDEDTQAFQTVAMNIIKGDLDPHKFVTKYLELKAKYGDDELRKRMGLGAKDAMFRKLIKDTIRPSLPESVQKELDKRGDKIRNVEDLSLIINSLYARYGSTLQYHFMMFTFGGKLHIMVNMDEEAFKAVKELADRCSSEGKDINAELVRRLIG